MTIGQPLPRPDGRAKVTGRARYAADHDAPNLLHAVLVTASTRPAGWRRSMPAERLPSLVSCACSLTWTCPGSVGWARHRRRATRA